MPRYHLIISTHLLQALQRLPYAGLGLPVPAQCHQTPHPKDHQLAINFPEKLSRLAKLKHNKLKIRHLREQKLEIKSPELGTQKLVNLTNVLFEVSKMLKTACKSNPKICIARRKNSKCNFVFSLFWIMFKSSLATKSFLKCFRRCAIGIFLFICSSYLAIRFWIMAGQAYRRGGIGLRRRLPPGIGSCIVPRGSQNRWC